MSNKVCSEAELEKRAAKRKNRKDNIKATGILLAIVLIGVLFIGGVASLDMADGHANAGWGVMADIEAWLDWQDGFYTRDYRYVEGMTYEEYKAACKEEAVSTADDDLQDLADSFNALIDRIKQGI